MQVEGKKKILTIDDHEDINNLLRVMLKRHNFIVETSSNIEDFFNKVISFGPHLCLVDLNLDTNIGFGFKIVESFRRTIGNEIFIIVISRRNDQADVIDALTKGADDYLTKPLDEIILVNKINTLFDIKSPPNLELPFYAIPTGNRDCSFSFPLQICELKENGLILYGPHCVAKGTLVELKGELIQQITNSPSYRFTVKQVSKDSTIGGYFMEIEFDSLEKSDFVFRTRKILLQGPPLGESLGK